MEATPRLLQLMFAYKRASDRELVDHLKSIDDEITPDVGRVVRRLLDHVNVVDQIFRAHLTGVRHDHGSTSTPGEHSLDTLDRRFSEADAWYEDFVRTIGRDALMQTVPFTFTDGKHGTMSRLEMLLHVADHATSHRGAAWALLRAGKSTPSSMSVASWLHGIAPSRRDHSGNPVPGRNTVAP